MRDDIRSEVSDLIKKLNLKCGIDEFENRVYWDCISKNQKLSEDFIRYFKNRVNWSWISFDQKLSEDFIREFKDRVQWGYISCHQKLLEDFIREFQYEVDWYCVSAYQKLSENFIREFEDNVNWYCISKYQNLSEDFIREFKDEVHWYSISLYQNLSDEFIEEFKDRINIKLRKLSFFNKPLEQKKLEIENYAKKFNLKYDDEYLYAFRNHDEWERGAYSGLFFYEAGVYYKDWRCDLNPDNENSFGLGIWPNGNTPIRVKIEDWGVAINNDPDVSVGKARVWGFEII